MRKPKVSVIIPAYNCANYVVQAIESCLNQDYENIEVIVVNDGSTDNTHDVVALFSEDRRVIMIDQQNQGVSVARNNGVGKASGKYMTFLDADDSFGDETISRNVDLLEANPQVDWLLFPIQRIDIDGNIVDEISSDHLPSFKYDRIEQLTSKEAFDRMSRRLLPTCVCGGLYRSTFFDCQFESGRYEDTIMVMDLLCKNSGLMLSPYGQYQYYDRDGSFINSEWDAEKWVSYTNVRIRTLMTQLSLFPEFSSDIERKKTDIYYQLLYLKAIHDDDCLYAKPLALFKSFYGNVNFSLRAWGRYIIKTWLKRLQKIVTQQ